MSDQPAAPQPPASQPQASPAVAALPDPPLDAQAKPPGSEELGGMSPPTSDPAHQEHGAQVHLTGAARAAARGGLHGDITDNTTARDMAIKAGEAADGTTGDGSTPDGRLPPDVVDGADQQQHGDPGKGEGKPGFRPEDQE